MAKNKTVMLELVKEQGRLRAREVFEAIRPLALAKHTPEEFEDSYSGWEAIWERAATLMWENADAEGEALLGSDDVRLRPIDLWMKYFHLAMGAVA